jgi:hypothetical protein
VWGLQEPYAAIVLREIKDNRGCPISRAVIDNDDLRFTICLRLD